jgi:hypothetical protein
MNSLTGNATLLGVVGMLATNGAVLASDQHVFEVTITNITAGQVFTPILLASHRPGVRLFDVGEPASEELEVLAEEGDPGPLMATLEGLPEVLDVTAADGPLPPGQSLTLEVMTRGNFDHVSLGAMLVPTNDGFFSLTDVRGPRGRRTEVLRGAGYDAGTELNDELCANIPGPPDICQGEGFNESRDGAEGFVHIHRGIHGIGDLDAAQQDWRNPVVEVRIRRVVR